MSKLPTLKELETTSLQYINLIEKLTKVVESLDIKLENTISRLIVLERRVEKLEKNTTG